MKTKIAIGTHAITIIANDHKMTNALQLFSKKFTITEMVTDYKGNIRPVIKSKFVGGNKFNNEFIFSVNALTDLLHTLKTFGYTSSDMEIEDVRNYRIVKNALELKGDKKSRDYQKTFIESLTGSDAKNSLLLALATGRGKALPLSTPIRTLGGWSTMGDVDLGDKIIGRDGKATKVTGIYPQGMRTMYLITFEDGRSLRADGDHLWSVYNKKSNSIMKTKEILNRLKRTKLKIDLILPEDISKNHLPMNLYLRGQSINTFLSVDTKLIYELLEAPQQDREDYLNGLLYSLSIEDSKIIIMDNIRLTRAISKLIYSLGGIAKVINYKNKQTLHYNLNEDNTSKLGIKTIKKIGQEEAVCITVDNKDRLFVVDDYIVTHNTFISASALSKINERVMIYILPKYIDKWIADCKELMKIEREEIFVIQGSADLKHIMTLTRKELKQYKIIIASNRTMYFYFKEYENTPFLENFTYPVLPKDLRSKLKVGVMLIDEVHQEFETVFKGITYLDIKRVIALSATLLSSDRQLSKIYGLMFPKANRLSEDNVEAFKNVKAIRYNIRDVNNVKFLAPGNRGYSQIKFEHSILRHGSLRSSYLEMIDYYTYHAYVKRKLPKEKLLIYAASIDMCIAIVSHLKLKFPKLDIRKFTGGDHYRDVIEPDIRVSTLGKAGAAIDIPGLITTIQTINTNSPQMNLQSIGRTRNIPGRDVYFIYLYCNEIRPHLKYHRNRQQLFYDSSKTYVLDDYPKMLMN